MVTPVPSWTVQAVDADNALLGYVTGWSSFRLLLRHRRGGTWTLVAGEGSGVEALQAGTRLVLRRSPRITTMTYDQLGATYANYTTLASSFDVYAQVGVTDPTPQVIVAGYVTRIEEAVDASGRVTTVSGITDTALPADRITLPTPEAAFSAQTSVAYWTESGPANFIIHRLVTRNAGMGAHRGRQVLDSRVGASVRTSPRKTATDWTDVSAGSVMWSGDTATVADTATAAFRMTNALDMTSSMATVVGQVTISGSCNVTILAYSNSTAAGAAPGQAGVVTNTFPIHLAANTPAGTFWAAEVMRERTSGKPWVRLQINVQAVGASRTVEFLNTGGVYTTAETGNTVTVNTRFKNLGEEVEELATAGEVTIYADTANNMPRLLVRSGTDRTDEIKLSRGLGNVSAYTTVLGAPTATDVLVAGEGEGTARITTSRSDTASATEWGRRIETFRDARDVDAADAALLAQRGDETLADSARTAGWNVESADVQFMAWPDDYDVGDEVTVVTNDVATTDEVAAVEVTVDSEGVAVRPVLGSAELADNEPGLYAAVRDLRRRLDQLEGRV